MATRSTNKTVATKSDTPNGVVKSQRIDDDVLRNITTVEQALELMGELYGGVDTITDLELGNGFTVTDDKDRLVNRPLLLLTSSFHFGDFGEFVSLVMMTLDTKDRLIVNDGSTGIFAQMDSLRKRGQRTCGIQVPRGFRKSEYDTCPECGAPQPKLDSSGEITKCTSCGQEIGQRRGRGKTYYLDTSG